MVKKSILFGIVIALFVFMAGVLFVEHLKTDVLSSRIGLSCTSVGTISDGNKLTCLLIDTVVPYFIISLISLSLGFIGVKIT